MARPRKALKPGQVREIVRVDPADLEPPDNARRKPGRPFLLTPAISKVICDYLRDGNFTETACAAAGIHKDTYYGWRRRGCELHRELQANPDMELTEQQE